jgi:hypothetical protein
MFNNQQTFPNLCENLYLMSLMSFLNLGILKRKPTKSIWIIAHVKLFKLCFWGKKIEKKTKIVTHMDLWKYVQILIVQKSLIIKQLRFSKNIFFIWVYHLVFHHILSPKQIWNMNQYKIFHFVMFQLDDLSIYFDFKSPLLLQMSFFINK